MTSRAEAIVAAIFTLLSTDTDYADNNVWRTRLRPIPAGKNLAIVVRQGPDTNGEAITLRNVFRQLRVTVEIYARGDVPDQIADALVVEVVSRLTEDTTLSGLCDDVLPGNKVPNWEARDTDLVMMDLDFLIDYEVARDAI